MNRIAECILWQYEGLRQDPDHIDEAFLDANKEHIRWKSMCLDGGNRVLVIVFFADLSFGGLKNMIFKGVSEPQNLTSLKHDLPVPGCKKIFPAACVIESNFEILLLSVTMPADSRCENLK